MKNSRITIANTPAQIRRCHPVFRQEGDRSRGFGAELLDWLLKQAREHACENLELDSGVQRFDAHRFYLLKRMNISSYHFRIKIEQKE